MLASQESERLTVGDIIAVLRDRAFALLVVLLGLPNCLPMPPPIPLVCGLVLLVIAIQIVAGMSAPWLPRRLLDQSIARETVAKAVKRAVPLLRRLERWSRPRLSVFDGAVGMRGMGVLIRTCRGRRDYTGGPNNFVSLALLDNVPALAAQVKLVAPDVGNARAA